MSLRSFSSLSFVGLFWDWFFLARGDFFVGLDLFSNLGIDEGSFCFGFLPFVSVVCLSFLYLILLLLFAFCSAFCLSGSTKDGYSVGWDNRLFSFFLVQ